MLHSIMFSSPFILEQVLSLAMALTFLKIIHLSFCRMSLKLCFLMFSQAQYPWYPSQKLILESKLEKTWILRYHGCCVLVTASSCKACGVCPVTGGVNFDLLMKTVVSAYHCCIVTFLPIINKYFLWRHFETIQNLILHSLLPTSFDTHCCFLQELIMSVMIGI